MSNDLEQLREDYGDELIDGLMSAAEQKINASVQQVQSAQFGTNKQLLSDRLNAGQINFDQVNNDPVFHDWLSKFDPNTGVQRQQKLNQAFNSGDIATTEAMFKEYVNGGGNRQQPQSNHAMSAGFGQQQGATASELRARHGQLMRRKGKAASKGDMVSAESIQSEMDAVMRQMSGA